MGGNVEILCGIAGSGKTARLLDTFRAELSRLVKAAAPGQAVWLTPTNRSRRETLRTLLDASLRVCFAPNVLTFDSFAERLLRSSGLEITPLSTVARRMVARSVIDEARSDGTLDYFGPVAATSGFLDLVLGFIADLKRDETWPEEFASACRQHGSRRRDIELSILYSRYQERLNALRLYDAEGRFWSARSTLAEGQRGVFARLSLVIVDGFADFTQPQYEILEHLASFAQRVIVSLPLEEPTGRADLFAKSAAARDEIRRHCRTTLAVVESSNARSNNDAQATFRHLADHLFDNPRSLPQLSHADGIEIITAAGISGETRAIAERIKGLLLVGIPADQIVVALREGDEIVDQLDETLAAAGIPHWCQTHLRFSQTPIARAIFALLQMELDDWAFDRLVPLLRSNYFRPVWQASGDRYAINQTPGVLRKWKLGSGRQRILQRLARLAAEAASEEERPHIEAVLNLLRALSNATDRLRQPADFSGWVDRLATLCSELGIAAEENVRPGSPSSHNTSLDGRDSEHWRQLEDVLYDAARTISLLEKPRALDLAEFVRQLRDVLDSQTFTSGETGRGKVLVLDASEIRNLEVPYLFLAGLTESSFPRGGVDDCLYTQAERRRFVRKSHLASTASTQQQDEMLLFYSIVTRARRKLTLSYPNVSSSGQPLFPSPYVAALRELFAPGALTPTVHGDLDPVPTCEQTLTTTDLRLLATEEVREEKPGLFRAMAERPDLAPVARGVLASADMAAARFEERGFTRFEGILRLDANLARLAEHYSRNYQFSATQLEDYATCPFHFLLSQVLGVKPPEPAEAEFDPRTRGMLLHRILADLHDPKRQRDSQLERSLRELIAKHIAPSVDADAYERALLTAERQFAELFAELYADHWKAYHDVLGDDWVEFPRPRYVELAFGELPERSSPVPRDSPPYATLGSGESAIRVRGQIDRIDVGRRETGAEFTVIDYKTRRGERFDLDDIRSGLALQLAIYATAIRQSGLLGPDATLFQMVYWNLTRSGCVAALKGRTAQKLESLDAKTVEEIEASVQQVVPKIAAGIRKGEFPVFNADHNCTGYCPYSTVCRVNQIRPLEREHDKRWGLSLP